MYLNEPGFLQACNLFQENEISFTECSIVSAMKILSIDKLATFDKDFKQFEEIETVPQNG